MYEYKTTIQMHDTDAAGVLFFANQFKITHDAYQAWLEQHGIKFVDMIQKQSYFLPMVHAESDYKAPLAVGDKITVALALENIGETSFTLAFTLRNEKNTVVGTGKAVHVATDAKTKEKIPLPADLRAFFKTQTKA